MQMCVQGSYFPTSAIPERLWHDRRSPDHTDPLVYSISIPLGLTDPDETGPGTREQTNELANARHMLISNSHTFKLSNFPIVKLSKVQC